MESNNVIYRSDKYSVLAEEVYSDCDGAMFELRLILNVLDVSIDHAQVWCDSMESLKIIFGMMSDTTVVKKFNEGSDNL